MVKSVTMVMSNKILSRGTQLAQASGIKKEWKKETIKYYWLKAIEAVNYFRKIIFRLLVILFVIKLYARTDIFKRIKNKHGQSVLNVVRKLENFKSERLSNYKKTLNL